MKHIYMLIYGGDWDDTKIILSLEEAIQASIKHPEYRVEIFYKSSKANRLSYRPTYSYYKNGLLHNCGEPTVFT